MNPDQSAQPAVHFRRYNDTPLTAFGGLTPSQMHQLLYDPWGPESPLRLRPEMPTDVLDQIPFLRLTEELLRIVNRDVSIKLTALGALPGKYLHELYGFGFITESSIEAGHTKLHREIDAPGLSTVHHNAVLAGLLRKVHGKLMLTKNGERLRPPARRTELMQRVFATFGEKFNWAYHDGYDAPTVGQTGWAYTLLLLLKFGAEARPLQFYADKYQQAFPFLLADLPGTAWHTPAEQLLSCYGLRVFEHFGLWFGLAVIEKYRFGREQADCLVLPTPLLGQLFELVESVEVGKV
ncbi:hypothetical protein [Hymenobacter terricola]|uniref:hypothetical protein n=1 Tax=Hymenobacter terricola TaxID=2819236 RepID=UPI001B3096D1|nr:hypothetical protein [Hymenobacter terricola]